MSIEMQEDNPQAIMILKVKNGFVVRAFDPQPSDFANYSEISVTNRLGSCYGADTLLGVVEDTFKDETTE